MLAGGFLVYGGGLCGGVSYVYMEGIDGGG